MKRWYLRWKASRAAGRGDSGSARALYERLVAGDPRDGLATMMPALCHEREGALSDALRPLDDAIRIAPFNVAAWVLRILARVPIVRRKLRPDAVQEALRHLDAGHRSEQLAEWKRWALEYIGGPAAEETGAGEPVVH